MLPSGWTGLWASLFSERCPCPWERVDKMIFKLKPFYDSVLFQHVLTGFATYASFTLPLDYYGAQYLVKTTRFLKNLAIGSQLCTYTESRHFKTSIWCWSFSLSTQYSESRLPQCHLSFGHVWRFFLRPVKPSTKKQSSFLQKSQLSQK